MATFDRAPGRRLVRGGRPGVARQVGCPFFGQGSDLVNELPGDSWLALAQPDLGKLLDYYVETFAPRAWAAAT